MTKTNCGGRNLYGHQRVWGSLRLAITPLIAGVVMEALPRYVSIDKDPIQVVFYMYMVIMLASVISCAFLFRKESEQKLSAMIG